MIVFCALLCYNFIQIGGRLKIGRDTMPQIRPITDLRDTTTISELCHAKREPVFITKNGYGDMVLMSMETYEDLIHEAALERAVVEAEAEYQQSKQLLNAEEALTSLRRKYFG
jgi:PHD/YefM family antitoxin component YafN of YafNO toxin-antitoxin module